EHIHPFQDGNGRVGRLLLNLVLLQHGLPPVTIHVEDHQRYYACLQAYDRTGDLRPTLRFLLSQYKKR
ncbi:MAG: Fic family protein, partial [Nanoarchaeota archaeon]|nr:Fic family protein [Nanoarchaeota archaeon]